MKLRAYETSWLDRIKEAETKRVLVVGPTGCGKTVVAVELVKEAWKAGKRSLFLAHRVELLSQAVNRLVDGGVPRDAIGVISGQLDGENLRAPVQVAAVQCFSFSADPPKADLVIIDEAHRALADTYQELLTHYPKAIVYGLTATPYRMDGQALGAVFGSLVQSAPPSELVSSGWLMRPLVYTVPPDQRPKLLGIKTQRGDYAYNELAKRSDLPHLIGSVVHHYQKHAKGRPTVVYGVNVAHCLHITEAFQAVKVRVRALHTGVPMSERQDMLEMLAQHELDVVVNCQILTEGWDCPEVRCAIVARPTLSPTLWFQIVGRVTRPGDIRPIVLDHAGNAIMHGLPLEDVDYSLEKSSKSTRNTPQYERVCPSCSNSVAWGGRVCSWCGHEWFSAGELPEVAEGTLVRLNKSRIKAKCAYEHCPSPHIPVERRIETGEAMHWICKRLRGAEKTRLCAYDKCPTPTVPLSPQSQSDRHRDCQDKKRAPKTLVKCTYEKCPTPDELFLSKTPDKSPVHGHCRELRMLAQRKCQYALCQTPSVPLSHKAHFQGVTMHRSCAARARSERVAPDRNRCKKCGRPSSQGREIRIVKGLCSKCLTVGSRTSRLS
jgi:superfamily II DNA or RNA helicase